MKLKSLIASLLLTAGSVSGAHAYCFSQAAAKYNLNEQLLLDCVHHAVAEDRVRRRTRAWRQALLGRFSTLTPRATPKSMRT